ncbi:hypothetical protein MSAN_00803000 [Mycena sanguinolenta]|uniref:protein-tyrosine-phosphatase n=1 Tax=Mycena sanguinolenta TaxID=230812 RepID=A0A8H7D9M9_9AGAR|nr:hypothetical protein MSAN_00803000 [Mycena sanguinolenta]
MSDFFSAVGDANAASNLPDNTKLFADAIAARFNAQSDESVLTARLLPPVLPLPVPREPEFDGQYTAVPPSALGPWLDDPKTLVVDIRPHAAYSSARIGRAVSLSVPSTLLKRPAFSLQRLSAMLPSASARARFSAWRTAPRILVYDADSAALSETSNIQGLLRKFRADSPSVALAWVHGGFQAVWQARRDLVDVVPPTPETETEDDPDDSATIPAAGSPGAARATPVLRAHHLPRAAFALASTTQAPRRPGPPLLNPAQYPNANFNMVSARDTAVANHGGKDSSAAAFNPFYDAVRQNTELAHGITEKIPLRLPRRVRRRLAELPFAWLRNIARRAAPVTPPEATEAKPSMSSSMGMSGTGAGANANAAAFATFRGPPDSSEDESSDSGPSVTSWRGSSPFPSSSSYPHASSSTSLLPSSSSAQHLSPRDAYNPHQSDIDEGTEALAMQFYRIELAEQRRMMGVMEHHSRESAVVATGGTGGVAAGVVPRTPLSGPVHAAQGQGQPGGSTPKTSSQTIPKSPTKSPKKTKSKGSSKEGGDAHGHEHGHGHGHGHGGFPFSITAGVEKGSKNRYRNIWPFEHARVRLHRLQDAPAPSQSARSATAPGPSSLPHGAGHGAQSSLTAESHKDRAQTYPGGEGARAGGIEAPPPSRTDSNLSIKTLTAAMDADADDSAIEADVELETGTEDEGVADVTEQEDEKSETSEEYDNYINASHVQPLGTKRRYIATQGPLEATFGDFWTLVWQQNVHVVVMLTREVEGAQIKCGTYWRPGTYGPLRVELLGCAAEGCTGVCALCSAEAGAEPGGGGFFSAAMGMQMQHTPKSPAGSPLGLTGRPHQQPTTPQPPQPPGQLIKRTLRLTHAAYPEAGPRRIVQLHYLGWPDMNVPEDASGVLGLVKGKSGSGGDEMEVEKEEEDVDSSDGESGGDDSDSEVDGATGVLRRALRAGNADAPVLLHCSAGVGRTGGFIAVDAVLDAVRQEAREMYAAGSSGVSPIAFGGEGSGSAIGAGGGSGGGSVARSGSEGISNLSAGMRASEISGGGEEDRMEIDVEVEDVDADMHTPMQVDSAEAEMRLGETTRRWAQRVADTELLSAFAPGSLPQTAFPSSSETGLGPASVPVSSTLGAPFQFQSAATHRTAFSLNLPAARRHTPHDSLPTTPATATSLHSQSPEAKSASLPLKMPAAGHGSGGALPLAVRRGYADRSRTVSEPSAAVPPAPASKASRAVAPPAQVLQQLAVPRKNSF